MPFNMSAGAIDLGGGPNPQWGLGGYRGGNTPMPSVNTPAPDQGGWETGVGGSTPHFDRGPGSGGVKPPPVDTRPPGWSRPMGRGPNPGWGRPPQQRPMMRDPQGQPFLRGRIGPRPRPGMMGPPGSPGAAGRGAPVSTGKGIAFDSSQPYTMRQGAFAEGGAVPHFASGGTFTTWSNPPGTAPEVPLPFGASMGYAGPPGTAAGAGSTANRSSSSSSNTTRGGSTSGSYIPDYMEEPFLNQLAQYSADHADQLFGRYASAFQPLEDELISDAREYASPSRIHSDMGRAGATVAQQMEGGRKAALQHLTDYGINVNSGRYAGLNRAEAVQSAAAQAGAMNQARMQDEQIARGLRSDAINLGSRDLQDAMGLTNIGMSLRYPPLGNNSESWNASDSHSSSVGAPPSSPGGGGGGGSRPSGGGGGGGSRPDPARPRDPNVPPPPFNPGPTGGPSVDSYDFNNPVGGGGGMGDQVNDYNNWYDQTIGNNDWSYFDDTGTPDYSGSPYADMGDFGGGGDFFGGDLGESFAGGGAIDMNPQGEDPNATTGGFVSRSLSPSGGQTTDDIPARLNADEFVIPRDVTMWKGQEFFQNLIMKSRQNRQGAPAKPTMQQPGQGAINMGQ